MNIDRHNDQLMCIDMMRRQSGVVRQTVNHPLIKILRELFREWGQPGAADMDRQLDRTMKHCKTVRP